MNQNINPEPQ